MFVCVCVCVLLLFLNPKRLPQMTKTGLNTGSVAADGGSVYLWGWNEGLSRGDWEGVCVNV